MRSSTENRQMIEVGEPVEQVEIPDTMWMGVYRSDYICGDDLDENDYHIAYWLITNKWTKIIDPTTGKTNDIIRGCFTIFTTKPSHDPNEKCIIIIYVVYSPKPFIIYEDDDPVTISIPVPIELFIEIIRKTPQEMVEILKDYYKKNRDKIKQLLKQYNFDKYVNIDQLNEKALRRLIGIITVRELLEREIDEEDP